MFSKIRNVVAQIKVEKPLLLNITNNVTMDFIANGLLSLGASPVMSQAGQEMEDLLPLVSAVVINVGTLNDEFIALCEHVCNIANQLKKPIILDPVGAGASRYRTQASLRLIDHYDIAIIRGNASEIMALSGEAVRTKGVDSAAESHLAMESAQHLSARYHAAVVVSGETDLIVDGDKVRQLTYGSPLMPMLTGTGCLLSAVVGAFHAVEKDRWEASALATAFYGMCGEKAAEGVQGPGSFKVKFLDELSVIPDGRS